MEKEEKPPPPKRTILERINFAYDPLVGSLSIPILGVATILEVIGGTFEWWKRLDEMGFHYVPSLNVLVYGVILIWASRAIFMVSERCGVAEKGLKSKETKLADHIEVLSCIHDTIHRTRDDLLPADKFVALVEMDDDRAERLLWDTYSAQLALLQVAMRKLTDADCHVCVKALMPGRGPEGRDGLVSICYGPAASLERKQNSLALPTNQGIATEALVTRKIAHSNDILKDDRYWPKIDRDRHAKTYRTVVSSPIFVNGAAQGVLCLDWKDPDRYSPDCHANVIASFTDMMSTACYLHQLSRIIREQST